MANMFNVSDNVVVQKKGGQSGTKSLTPAFQGEVLEVLSGGTEYRVRFQAVRGVRNPFVVRGAKSGVVAEADLTSA
jgi:hypothetical protein